MLLFFSPLGGSGRCGDICITGQAATGEQQQQQQQAADTRHNQDQSQQQSAH
jgi:hypothetical protein